MREEKSLIIFKPDALQRNLLGRGDFSMSIQTNIVHASENKEIAETEIARFFKPDELFEYKKIDFDFIYGEEERGT